MVTNYPQHFTAIARETDAAAGTRVARAITRVGQLVCGMRGHDPVLHFEGRRVMMRCTSCGHDTPGWDIGERQPRRRYEGDAQRHVLATPRRVELRRSA